MRKVYGIAEIVSLVKSLIRPFVQPILDSRRQPVPMPDCSTVGTNTLSTPALTLGMFAPQVSLPVTIRPHVQVYEPIPMPVAAQVKQPKAGIIFRVKLGKTIVSQHKTESAALKSQSKSPLANIQKWTGKTWKTI